MTTGWSDYFRTDSISPAPVLADPVGFARVELRRQRQAREFSLQSARDKGVAEGVAAAIGAIVATGDGAVSPTAPAAKRIHTKTRKVRTVEETETERDEEDDDDDDDEDGGDGAPEVPDDLDARGAAAYVDAFRSITGRAPSGRHAPAAARRFSDETEASLAYAIACAGAAGVKLTREQVIANLPKSEPRQARAAAPIDESAFFEHVGAYVGVDPKKLARPNRRPA